MVATSLPVKNKYGHLTPIRKTRERRDGRVIWEFRCGCGKQHYTYGALVFNGKIKSCGCLSVEKSTDRIISLSLRHGQAGKNRTNTYNSWRSMFLRLNRNCKTYAKVKICKRWNKFENFYADMGDRPPGMSIDRINNDGNYEPSNCRWATQRQQTINRRITIFLTNKGHKRTLKEWCEIYSIEYRIAHYRLRAGWKFNDIFNIKENLA